MSGALGEARDRLGREQAARLTALEQLRHADRLATVGKLASGIAHELGTPLNVVAGRAQLIAGGELEGDDARASAKIRRFSAQVARTAASSSGGARSARASASRSARSVIRSRRSKKSTIPRSWLRRWRGRFRRGGLDLGMRCSPVGLAPPSPLMGEGSGMGVTC